MPKEFQIVRTDKNGMELIEHGTALFPLNNIYDDFSIMDTVAWHWHKELEIGILKKGRLQAAIDTERYDLKEGDGFFINSEVLHAIFDLEHTGSILRSMVFHPRLIGSSDSIFYQGYVEPLMKNSQFKGMIFKQENPGHAEQLEKLSHAISLCDRRPTGYELLTRSSLSEIILYLFTAQHSVQKEFSETDRRNEARLRAMLGLIESRYQENITLKELADAAFVSKTECIRCFKAITGRTPIQYLKEFRIQKAAELLISTDMNISMAGEACGFLEMSYFTRCFRKQFNATPSEYRRRFQKQF